MEIERKWMVNGWPKIELPVESEYRMRQGYLCVAPTVRIREEAKTGGDTSWILCFKKGRGLVRNEIEMPVSRKMFYELEEMIGDPLIEKVRRSYRLPEGLILEVNHVDEGLASEFWYAEIEFESKEQALSWRARKKELKEYLKDEVTEVDGSSMGAYWIRTRLAGM